MESEKSQAIENLKVIRQILEKTRCDMREAAMLYIWIGVVEVCMQVVFMRIPATLKYHVEYQAEWIVLGAFLVKTILFLYYYQRVRKKENRISKTLMVFSYVGLILVPTVFEALSRAGEVLNVWNRIEEPEKLWYWAAFGICRIFVDILCTGMVILLAGMLSERRIITLLGWILIIVLLISAAVTIWNYSLNPVLPCLNLLFHLGGITLFGILLKFDGRRKTDGAE